VFNPRKHRDDAIRKAADSAERTLNTGVEQTAVIELTNASRVLSAHCKRAWSRRGMQVVNRSVLDEWM